MKEKLRLTNFQKQHDIIGLAISGITEQKKDIATTLRQFWDSGIRTEDDYCRGMMDAYDEVIGLLKFVSEQTGVKYEQHNI